MRMSPTTPTDDARTRIRVAIAAALALALTMLAMAGLAGPARAGSQAQPNIVVVTTDDQPLSMMRGRYMPKTTKQIGERGTTFTNHVVTTPLCCPSRATMLTGQYAHNHAVLTNHYELLEDKDNVLPVWLRQAGYRTAHVGKFLNAYEQAVGNRFEVAPGWDVWFTAVGATRYFDYEISANGRRRHFGDGPRSHITRVLNRKAASLVRRVTPGSQPLYLQLDHRAPHTETGTNSGGRCGARAVPEDARDEERVRDEPLPTPPSFNEADVSDKPSYIRDSALLNRGRIKKITKRYDCGLAALRSVDRGVKKVVQALKQTGELRNTVLIFTSDNGYYFGEHRIGRDKTHPYEEGIRVPLLVRVPARLGGAMGSKRDEPVANIDLAPTLLELAGADSCAAGGDCRVMDGRSMVPLLRGREEWPAKRGLLIEYDGASSKGTSSCEYHGIRAQGWMYVDHVRIPNPLTRVCEETEQTELYNLVTDPFQLHSLPAAGSPVIAPLRARLSRLRDCAGIEGRDPVPADGLSYCE
jgi:N-acetylglucosamine-6-sulfatase